MTGAKNTFFSVNFQRIFIFFSNRTIIEGQTNILFKSLATATATKKK
jgi:hypothetical protein